MKRVYLNGEDEDIQFFIGTEVEHTPAHGMKTLFIVGVVDINGIEKILKDPFTNVNSPVKHLFFGANHSYDPVGHENYKLWETMITYFLDKGFMCSLDIPFNQVEEFHESGLCEYDNFIPQIRIPIPYIKLWNYNTTIKIDDIGYNVSNPGVWSHSLHTLMDRKYFTDWNQYKEDTPLK